jgi:uncharacterized damage-inducible protein DinB
MPGHVRKLVDHLKWADAAALGSLREATVASERAIQLYAHIVAAEAVWLARIAGRTPDVAVWPALSLDEAASLAQRNAEELDRVVASLRADGLAREIAYRNSAGDPFQSSLEDILLHVALHGAYHRGQVAMLVRDASGEPAPTDYIAFVRGAPAARTVPPPVADRPR